jgi:hypothetical protein
MFYDTNEVNALLNCKKCEGRLDEPSLLECGNSICSHCSQLIILDKNRIFKCLGCDDFHTMPLLGLPSNNLAKSLLSIKGIAVSRGEKFNILQENLNKIQENNCILKYNLTNPSDFVKDHFIEIRNQVQLNCENQCLKLNDKCQEIIAEIDQFALDLNVINLDSFKYSFKIVRELEEFKLQADKYLNIHNINDEKLKELNEHAELLMIKSKNEMDHLKRIVLKGKFLEFIEKFEDITRDNLGCFLNFDCSSIDIQMGENFKKRLFEISEISDGDWRLIYRASRDGYLASDFHSKCDDKPNTLIIIRSCSNCLFGGYTEKSWSNDVNDSDILKPDPKSFIFSLLNTDRRKLIFNCSENNGILCNKNNGPKFGEDLVIDQNAKSTDNYSNLGSSYIHPDYVFGSPRAKNLLADRFFFRVIEMDVYTRF